MTAQQKATTVGTAPIALQQMNIEEKKALMKELLNKKNPAAVRLAPMSNGQQALWFVHQSAPQTAAYNVAMAVHIDAGLDRDLLQQALNLLLQRHEILRTSYGVVEGQNVQQIHPGAELKLSCIDARILTEEQLHARIVNDYRLPFDLGSVPPMRARCYQLAHDQCVLLLVVHHIAIDATSLWLLMDELAQLYQALNQGETAMRRSPALKYREFCQRQQDYLASARGRADRNYWQATLNPDQPPLTLDISRPRPGLQVFDGDSHYFSIPAALATSIKTLAQQQGVTCFSLLLAAWYCLLARHSGQEDICVASPTAGRVQTDYRRAIGYFVNPVILRTALQDNPSVANFLQRVQHTVLEALEHQQYPFATVIEALNPRRDPGLTPYSQASFVFQQADPSNPLSAAWTPGQQGESVQWAGLDLRQYPLNQQEGQFELELELTDNRDKLCGILKYNTALFDEPQIEMLATHYQELLQSMVTNPESPIARLNMLSEAEQQQLARWNDTRRAYPPHDNLQQLIEAQVARTPNAVALKFGDEEMTYAAMNAHANRLAHFLLQQGVELETKVGVCMERSFDMVIALLAIIKAGGAYVPVDPNYPAARLGFLLQDMETPLLLTQAPLLAKLPELDTRIVCVEQLFLEDYAADDPQLPVGPSNLAYMIYTSGSTGNPKGAMNTHAGICNRLLWMQEAYQLTAADSVLQKTPFSFDVSVWEFFWPLLAGARLVIARPDGHKDVDYLIDIIRREQITTLHFVPSMLSLFVANPEVSRCDSIRRVICSGEALSHDLQQRFFQQLDTELHNLYGPTEAAIDVTAWQCRPDSSGSVVPIGKPIANIQIHVVDKHLQPVPIGVNGELLIGGIGVARGYFKREQLNASKFIADPFSGDSFRGDRTTHLYRSGDLVRYLPDGNIEYLQRMDDQVKLRGFRIELGEVEAMLNRCRGVHETVVVKRAHGDGSEYLLAFATRDGSDTDAAAILQQAAELLPAHCVPAALEFLPAMPLTPNGKVDRRALPEHRFEGARQGAALAPRNEVERTLLRLWRELLPVQRLSIDDNFFALGGHSLLAVRLMAAIETELGQRLPLASLMQHPTIAGLAQLIEAQPQQHWNSLVAIQQEGDQTPLFLVPGGGGNVLYFYPLAEQLGHQRPVYGLQARGLDGVSAPLDNLQEIAAAMVLEIRQRQPQGPYLIGGHCVGGLIAHAITQQLVASGAEIEQLLILDAPAPHFFTPRPGAAPSRAQWIGILVGSIAQMTGQELALDPVALEPLGADEQLEVLRGVLSRAGVVANNTPLAQIRGLLQVFIGNAQLHYQEQGNIHKIPVTLYRARDFNPHYDYRHHDDPGLDLAQSSLGWQGYASGPVQVQLVAGDHITMLAPAQAEGLAAALARRLQEREI
ncbi:amino acid adenylation domain-containing protein [Pseudomaricurvus alcaniphilus]|uniref:non-ribosomal peptide synthetase n=1 Tax=Pseudomaricurvus alcaniphilus TaxID=1166482 RepID=UPI001407FAC7|nr:non-ribosomal peptide synthetase [Pseudomaricurvus alcaniphilus]NHN38212.1 amino acid adenylation domain-containing protein [Pseudomaricurvus alcaniphilus]